VVGGTARGRRLLAPKGRVIRPTSDRVREAVLNMVTSRLALEGAAVADLFAGTGALGIEALSRGAASVVFVDHDRVSIETVNTNLAATALDRDGGADVRVVRADVLEWVRAGPAVDIAFCDPPYDFGGWDKLLGGLRASLAVLESDSPVEVTSGWEVLSVRHHGGTVVTLVRPLPRCPKGPT
jgi:16S rRNA (guanine966-N2)-methyltransferase